MGTGPPRRVAARSKRELAAALVRKKIADGTLKPGAPVPSGAALARELGYSVLTCRAGLKVLLDDGTLVRGASRGARLRVAPEPGSIADADALRVALSAALAARRRALGLTQPAMATLLEVAVTTIGHAETGRVWQSRRFWGRADTVLGGAGLLRMYDDFKAAQGSPVQQPRPPVVLPLSVAITQDGVTVTWPDGTETYVRPPGRRDM